MDIISIIRRKLI